MRKRRRAEVLAGVIFGLDFRYLVDLSEFDV